MRRYLVASVACGVVIAAATIGAAVVLAHMVAGIITDPDSRIVEYWSGSLTALAGLWLVRAIAQWLQGRLSQNGATAVIGELSTQVLRTVTALPPRQLAAERDTAAVVVTRGLDGLRPYFTAYLPAALLAGILTPAAVVAIALYDLESAVIVLIALPLIPIFMILIGLVTRERSAASLAAMTTLQSRLLDLVAGIPTLRALGRATGSAQRIAELGAAHRRSAMATLRIAFLSALVLELLATLGVALVAVSVGLRLVFGEMTLAAGLTALLLAPEVFWPLRRVGVEYHAAQDGKTAAEKAAGLLDTLVAAPGGTRTVTAAGATIHVDALGADLEAGQVTVLTGPNGAGKSTALQAILGLTAPSDGKVLVDGVDVADLDPTSWWRQVAWLPHRPVLIPGSIRDNLDLFGPLPDPESACRASGFDEVLDSLPGGPETVLGRGGVGLSLGQRQRLGLARALGSAAPVLLLDEPTAHLDGALEERVLAAIVARARAGSTVVVVGHRDPILAIGDHVVHIGVAHLFRDDPLLLTIDLLRPRLPRLLLAIALGVLSLGSALGLAGISAWLITKAWQMPPVLDLSVAAVAVRALGISRGVFGYCQRLASHDVALRAAGNSRTGLYRRLAEAPADVAMRLPSGELVARVGSSVDELSDVLVRAVLPIAVAVVLSLAAVGVVAVISPAAALVLAVCLLLAGVLAPVLVSRAVAAAEAVAAQHHSERDSATMLALEHAPELRVSGRLSAIIDQAERQHRDWGRASDRAAAPAALAAAVPSMAIAASVLGAVIAGISLAGTVAPTTVAILMLLPLSAFEATTALPGAAVQLSRSRIAARRLLALTEPDPRQRERPPVPSVPLRAGDRLAVTGPSGCGKTTLLMSMANELGETPGEAAFFAEDAHLFSTTVRDNLLVARGDATDDEVVAALRRVGLITWLESLPDGLATVLVGGAAAVSAGQRRRLLLARALVSTFPVVLLDEPTEHLDAGDAGQLLTELLTPGGLFPAERTVVVATHHLPGDVGCRRLDLTSTGNLTNHDRVG